METPRRAPPFLRYTVSARYASGMGQKTSVYLTDDVAARSAATGLPPGEIYRRGLEAIEATAERESQEAMLRRIISEELDARLGERKGDGNERP